MFLYIRHSQKLIKVQMLYDFFFSHISQNKKHCPYDAPMPYKINFPPKHFHHVLTSHLQNHSSTICLALALSVVDHEPMKNHHFFSLFQKMIFFYNNTQQTHKKDFIFFHSLLIVILLLCRDDVK